MCDMDKLDTVLHDAIDAILKKNPDLPLDAIFKEFSDAIGNAWNLGFDQGYKAAVRYYTEPKSDTK